MKYLVLVTLIFAGLVNAETGIDKVINSMDKFNESSNKQTSKFLDSVEMSSIEDEISPDQFYKTIDNSLPILNQAVSVYMGDRMIHSRSGYYADCIKPKFSTEDYFFGAGYEIKEGVLICKTDIDSKEYTPSYINFKSKKRQNIFPVTVKENKNGTFNVCVSDMGSSKACKKNATRDELQMEPAFISVEGSMQKTIEYMGVNNGIAKFVYSEFIDGLARDAFTREFEIDLSAGKTAAWKGAVFEIIEANNAQITYKVIRHFPQN
jgi:hypothetical protein